MWAQRLWHWVFPFPGLAKPFRSVWITNRKMRRAFRALGYHPEEGDQG